MERIVKKIKLIHNESIGGSPGKEQLPFARGGSRTEAAPTFIASILTFALMTGEELGFVGGQYIILNSGLKNEEGKDLKRAYSIFSSDLEQKTLQICVQNVPEGRVSGFLANLTAGAELEYSGPWGKFVGNPLWPLPGKSLLIATHTGITASSLIPITFIIPIRNDANS